MLQADASFSFIKSIIIINIINIIIVIIITTTINRAVNPLRLQILRIDGEWLIDDIIMQAQDVIFWGKKRAKKMLF